MLRVLGKGDKLREVPVPIDVVSALSAYLVSRGLSPDPENIGNQGAHRLSVAADLEERAPNLAARLERDARAGISASTLYDQLKAFFGDCARELRRRGQDQDAERLDRASVHWLRHTHASHAIGSGAVPIEVAQQVLGHASLSTTTVYVTTEQRQRMRAMDRFWSRQIVTPVTRGEGPTDP